MEQSEQDTVPTERSGPAAPAPAETAAPGSGVPVFSTENVSIWYGSFKAVTDVSLPVYENEITAFIGSSGSGKTTVLRAFNRMNDLVPGARVDGQIDYRGQSLYGPGGSPIAVRRRIGMVFQKPNPFPKSIYDNVAYGPRINGERNRHKLDEIVERSLRQAALWDEVKNRLKSSGPTSRAASAEPRRQRRDAGAAIL
jgi:phosphate transport system ATP-binding protein